MREALKEMTEKQIMFICEECNLSEIDLFELDEGDVYSLIFEKMCEIEIDEVCSKIGDEDTERCEIASDIVTVLSNTIPR